VYALATSGTNIYAGGAFANAGGQPRNNLAQLDITTGNATAWAPNPDGEIHALATSGTTVYAGGFFQNIGGQPRNSLAASTGVRVTLSSTAPPMANA